MYLASDGGGSSSFLWSSHGNGQSWFDTGGRTGGRHSVFVLLKDRSILALGGKQGGIDGYMPQSLSRGLGKTWQISPTPFPALASNQRPSLIRLLSGRLFFASDYQTNSGVQPAGLTKTGSFVALSDDEGKTWQVRDLPGTLPNVRGVGHPKPGTLGYSVARQAPNGLIHLLTSMGRHSLHYEINESWIFDQEKTSNPSAALAESTFPEEEKDPSARTRAVWSAKIGTDGCYRLDGKQTWFHADGRKQWEVTYQEGRKVGTETYWRADDTVLWRWEHLSDGTSTWTHFWPNGRAQSESRWRESECIGTATRWDAEGKLVSQRSDLAETFLGRGKFIREPKSESRK
jgi:hypothetical protein